MPTTHPARRGQHARRCLIASLLVLCTTLHALAQQETAPVAVTRSGAVRGTVEHGILTFKGIPYAAPTGGDNRFRPPRPAAVWERTRDATAFGPRCPQLPAPSTAAWSSWTEPTEASEDCLSINIWTPGLRDGKRRPVMVWLHGGVFSVGSGGTSVYDGTRLAARGDVVLVSLNHRLNVFGYLYLAHLNPADYADSGNVGQLDIIAALKWVRDNIGAFGGDPRSVMIFGESGGGGKVGALMAMPSAQGLFQRAAMQSGFSVTAISSGRAMQMTRSIIAALGLPGNDTLAQLRALPPERLLAALQQVTHGMPFGLGPVVDGRALPRNPFSPDAPVISGDVPLIVGYNRTETTVLFPPAGVFDLDWPGLTMQLKTLVPDQDPAPLIAALRKLHPQATPSDLYFIITTERTMGANARAVAERKSALMRSPVYLYRLDWRTPVEKGRLRSPHSLDVPMVFDNIARSSSLIGAGAAEAQSLADVMSIAWIAFARSGSPNAPGLPAWPPFDLRDRATMIFNVTSRAIDDPSSQERALLAPYTPEPSSP